MSLCWAISDQEKAQLRRDISTIVGPPVRLSKIGQLGWAKAAAVSGLAIVYSSARNNIPYELYSESFLKVSFSIVSGVKSISIRIIYPRYYSIIVRLIWATQLISGIQQIRGWNFSSYLFSISITQGGFKTDEPTKSQSIRYILSSYRKNGFSKLQFIPSRCTK